MGVSKVVYGGKTLVDLTADSVTAETLAKGITAHDATGTKITGTATAQNYFAKARRAVITLPASGWALANGVYTQQVSANVTANDSPFSQCVLSADYATAVDEMREMQWIEKIETYNGYIIASCFDCPGMAGRPDIDLTISLVAIDGITEAALETIACANAKQITVTAPASGWEWDGHIYSQTIAANVQAGDVLFGDGLFSADLSAALEEVAQLPRMTDILPGAGSLTISCYDTDNSGPPDVDISLCFKVFSVSQ